MYNMGSEDLSSLLMGFRYDPSWMSVQIQYLGAIAYYIQPQLKGMALESVAVPVRQR